MTSKNTPKPVVLCILDGWGHRDQTEDNAVALGNTPNWDRYLSTMPHNMVETSGTAVGLPAGQMGNSEVGHTNLGAGRVVMQDLPRIDQDIADGSLARQPALRKLIARLKDSRGALHLMGLLSPGGVHSHQRHMAAVACAASHAGIPVWVHAFTDGRDTPPRSARDYVIDFMEDVRECPSVRLGTLGGRYFAMDRDHRWERVHKAYDAMVDAAGPRFETAEAAITDAYDRDITDEFIEPAVLGHYTGMRDGDAIMMINFRSDRARQILQALLDPAFHGFQRPHKVQLSAALGMAEYSRELNPFMETLYPSEEFTDILGEVVSRAGRTQLRIAETEKYAHVTFFFNGGEEQQFEGEERILVPSPKVPTYDQQPQMSAAEVTDRLVRAIESDRFDLVILNYANGDMVGHTGVLDAAETATSTVDACLGRLEQVVRDHGGCMMVTADHGNCELMRDPETGQPHTSHTVGPVDIVLVDGPKDVTGLDRGCLADVAPTLLDLMGLDKPEAMTGHSLLKRG